MKKPMNVFAVVLCAICAQAVEFDYDVNADGTITLKGVRGSVPADLVIPSEIDGRIVTGIGAKAFAGEIDLDGVFIPETVTSVGAGAFCGESKNYPKSNESFGVKEIFVEKGNTRFSMVSGMLYDNVDKTVVAANSGISGRVVLPMGCEVVGDSAFQAKHFITEVVIPLSLRRLEYKAFSECSGLTRFDCSSSSLELIGEKCFKDSWNISRFDFPKTLLWIAEKALSSDAALCGKKTALKEIVFAGGVPEVQGDLYPYDADVTTYVFPDMGWDDGVEIGIWQGRPIRYVDADPLDDLPVFVPGEKVSLAIPALIGYTAKKLPSGLKLNKKTGEITGAAKKPTGEAGVTVTFTKKNEPTLTAQFVVADWPQIAFSCPGLESAPLAVGVTGDGEGIPLEMEPLSAVKSVKASKLPSGMKLAKDRKTGLWSITGAPKKAGDYTVTLTLTTTYGSKQVLTIPVHVAALPQWATGTFGGMVGRFIGPIENDDWRPYGMIEMKITTAGKITAKIAAGGKKYSFSVNGFDSVDEDGDYHFRMTTKKGEVYEGEISATYHDVAKLVQVEDADDPEGSFTIVGREPYFAIVWRNEHGKDGRLSADPTGRAQKVMDAIKAFKTVELAQFDPAYGSVVLKIDAKGKTKLSGKTEDGVKISGASFLMLDDDCYHVIADMVVYDKKSGNVYDITPCWQPIFDGGGAIVDWDWECCEHDLRIYPFE